MITPTDPALSALLRRADPAADASSISAADFAAGVHARIRSADTAPLRASAGGLARQLFPLAAAFAVLASLGAGSAVAYARERDARTETFASAYARRVDPWQMHNADSAGAPSSGHRHP